MKAAASFAMIIGPFIIAASFFVFFAANKTMADNVGVMGQTYPIIEMDFLQLIELRLHQMQQNGEWQTLQQHMQSQAAHYRDRPEKVLGVTRAIETKSWSFDPSITVDHDVMTPEGVLIAVAGTRVNPLEHMNLTKTLIFFDADDEDQVNWVMAYDKKVAGRDKLILVNGSLLSQEKQFAKSIYFDQAGVLTTRLGIHHVPAVVVQEGLHLKISEISL